MAIPADVMKPFSPQEYLELERQAEFKGEYVDGKIVAMSGGSPNHSRLKIVLPRVADSQLQGKPCETLESDMRVPVDPQLYSYPDLSVVCPEGQFDAEVGDNLLSPTVIFEVLAPPPRPLTAARSSAAIATGPGADLLTPGRLHPNDHPGESRGPGAPGRARVQQAECPLQAVRSPACSRLKLRHLGVGREASGGD